MEFKKYPNRIIIHFLVSVVTWCCFVPVIVFDIISEIYHHLVFSLLRIPMVDRKKYVVIWDRTELEYLSFVEKIGCAYCGYINGLAHYWVVIAAETEKYWCRIKHRRSFYYQQNNGYLEYGDEDSYNKYGHLTYSQRLLEWIKSKFSSAERRQKNF